MDEYTEFFTEDLFERLEKVPGFFGEITFKKEEKISIVGGLRYDHHNIFGGFFTPRAHVRYAPSENTVFRVSAGRGQRTASVFAENLGVLSSSREFILSGDLDSEKPYGLDPEVAWNLGMNIQQEFEINEKRASLGVDFFRTNFTNQVVIDYDQAFNELNFYNLTGDSYSNSLQFLFEMEPISNLDVRLAYRMNDVKTQYRSGMKENPLISRDRAFVNLAFETNDQFKFDYTLNVMGSKRIPALKNRAEIYSPSYLLSNLQLSKAWKNTYEIYLGVENLFNYRQENPIISATNPYSENFDASLVWGPIFGRNVYAGVRYKIFNAE